MHRRPSRYAGSHRRLPVALTLPGSTATVIGSLIALAGAASASMTVAYRLAATGWSTAAFTAFWLALVPLACAVVIVLVAEHVAVATRGVALAVLSLVTYLPMVLRTAAGPAFYDELAHWGQSARLISTGVMFTPNIVPVVGDYPGLQAVTLALVRATGAPLWTVALLLVGVLHVALLAGVWQLARLAGLGERSAALAAAVYAFGPGFLFFTSMYAYESLGIVLEVWALASVVGILRTEAAARRRHTALALAAGTAAALTHHLSALVLVGFLTVLCLATVRSSAPREASRRAVGVTAVITAVTLGWIAWHGAGVYGYLAVFPQQGLAEISHLLHPAANAAGSSRAVFGGSGLPAYEPLLAMVAVPITLGLGVIGAWMLRREARDPVVRALVALSLLYPASLPFVLTASGAPGAHRSWPFTWQLLAPLAAVGLTRVVRAVRAPARIALTMTAAAAAAVILVGSTAADFNAEARFPGPYMNGVDGRSVTPEGLAVATWIADHSTSSTRFVASDIYTAGIVAAYSGDEYDSTFPTWDLTFYTGTVKVSTVRRLATDRITFLVIDDRVDSSPFRGGYYIDPHEPGANTRTAPIAPAALAKLSHVPWLSTAYVSAHYVVYTVVPRQAATDCGCDG